MPGANSPIQRLPMPESIRRRRTRRQRYLVGGLVLLALVGLLPLRSIVRSHSSSEVPPEPRAVLPDSASDVLDLSGTNVSLTLVADLGVPGGMVRGRRGDSRIFVAAPDGTIRVVQRHKGGDGRIRPDRTATVWADLGRSLGPHGRIVDLSFDRSGSFLVVSWVGDGVGHVDEYDVSSGKLGRRYQLFQQAEIDRRGIHVAFDVSNRLLIAVPSTPGSKRLPGVDYRGSLLRVILVPNPTAKRPYDIPVDNPNAADELFGPVLLGGLGQPARMWSDSRRTQTWILDSFGQSDQLSVIETRDARKSAPQLAPDESATPEGYGTATPGIYPVAQVTRPSADCEWNSGAVYRGHTIGRLIGAQLLTQSCSGGIAARVVSNGLVTDSALLVTVPGGISDIGAGPGDEIYVMSASGSLYRLDPPAATDVLPSVPLPTVNSLPKIGLDGDIAVPTPTSPSTSTTTTTTPVPFFNYGNLPNYTHDDAVCLFGVDIVRFIFNVNPIAAGDFSEVRVREGVSAIDGMLARVDSVPEPYRQQAQILADFVRPVRAPLAAATNLDEAKAALSFIDPISVGAQQALDAIRAYGAKTCPELLPG